jgi:transcriptional regulator with XRE-family HTH domain
MPRKNLTEENLPLAIQGRLRQWGLCVRHARIRQRITVRDLATRIQISTQTLARLESGDASVQAGSYLTALWVLGLLAEIAPEPQGGLWQGEPEVKRVRPERDDDDF